MPNSSSRKNKEIKVGTNEDNDIVIRIPNIKESLAKDIESDPIGYIANITLDYFEARSLAYTILAKVCHIEKDMLLCDCGREKNCVCPVCNDDS